MVLNLSSSVPILIIRAFMLLGKLNIILFVHLIGDGVHLFSHNVLMFSQRTKY